jgi:ceramide glucosyltransferase
MFQQLHWAQSVSLWQILFLTWTLSVSLVIFGTIRALLKLRTPEQVSPEQGSHGQEGKFAPISILKPLKGADEGLLENLESFFRLDYPVFELLFSVSEQDDPVIPLIRQLIKKYPEIPTRFYIGSFDVGSNPKVNNIFRSYKNAQYDTVLISDSNTRVRPDYLKKISLQFKDDVAMQSSVVYGAHPKGLGGQLEATFLNTYYARSILMVEALGHPCLIGKCMLFRKSLLEKVGGLISLGEYIAEDYEAGHRLNLAGYKVQYTRDPIEQHIGNYSLKSFWSRHVRWGRIRKLQAPLPFCAEFFIGSIASGIIGAAAVSQRWGIAPLHFFAIHMLCWFFCDSLIMHRMGQKFRASTALYWMVREIVHLPLWIHISLGNSIEWRGQTIRLHLGAVMQPIYEDSQELVNILT